MSDAKSHIVPQKPRPVFCQQSGLYLCSQGTQANATSKHVFQSVGVFGKGDHLLFVRCAAPYKGTRVFLSIL